MAQTDADKAAGVMRFTFGRDPVECRALPNGAARRWFRTYVDNLTALGSAFPKLSLDRPASGGELLDASEKMASLTLDSIKEWDREGTLPSREWLADNATSTQLQIALDDMKDEAAGPFAQDLVTLAMLQIVAQSQPPSSTNGHSSIGAAIPATSTKRSRPRR